MNLKNPAIKMLSRWLDRDAKSHRERSRRHLRNALRVESLESRKLLTTAMMDGDWNDPSIWSEGVPTEETRAIIGHGVTVELSSDRHEAKELVVHGDLVVPEEASFPDKRLKANWVHVNSGGQFIVGTAENRYDEGDFTLELTGTDKYATHLVPTNMGGNMPGTMEVRNNDGFLMTGMMGRVQFYGEEKISFTKLAATAGPSDLTITVASVIERNFNEGDMVDGAFVTSAEDDGEFNWEVGDQIVIASSSYDYREQEVRLIENIEGTGDTRTLTLDAPLQFRHYGEKEIYGDPDNAEPGTQPASESYEIDMRAEVALLSRNIKIQGSAEQDTDLEFGDRWHIVTPEHVSGDETHVSGGTFTTEDINVVDRIPATDLTPNEIDQLPDRQAEIGVGGHVMFMHDSAQDIVVDGVQLDRLGQASQKGRYPIHWHLGGDRTGDILRNSSVTNSNNRGVTIHGTDNLLIEGVVLHDIHGHGFFFEDAVETGNTLIGNLVIGVHAVGGDDDSFANPGQTDPFIVDTHDSFRETNARFSASAAYWITNPDNTFVGNIAAGAGDSRFTDTEDKVRDWADPGPAGTGFWFALPRTAIGLSSKGDLGEANQAVRPIFADLRQFDYNTSHTTAIGLNFDRGSDIEDGSFYTDVNLDSIQPANEYEPRSDASDPNSVITNTILGFTNYKASEAAMYHRGKAETVQFDGLRIADSANGPWAVSENIYTNSLFVGHSKDNAQFEVSVGGPRLYDGSGLYTNTHFAGFGAENAYTFQVEGSSFGPTMYHAFLSTSFEKDGTYQNLAHAVSDFTDNPDGHNLGQPSQWTKAVMDFDGSLTGAAGGGVGYSIVPSVDFLIDADDTRLPDWDAYLTDDIYARLRIQNLDDGEALFPPGDTGEPLVRYTSADGDIIDAMGGHEINQQFYWTQIATKADSNNDGIVEDTLTVEFMRNGVPANGFALNMTNQDGGRPALSPEIESKVTQSRLVTKFIGAQNYTPSLGQEMMTEAALREVHSGVAFYRDGLGNLYLNTSIVDQPWITLVPGEALQTHFPEAIPTIGRGTVLEAEHFDVGMEGIAYHDSDSVNSQGSFRTDTGVDATESGITDIEDGEWLEYTANVDGDGYSVGFQVASTVAGGQIHISAAPSNSAGFLRHLGTVNIPDTGGDFQAVWHDGIDLNFVDGDAAVLRFTFSGGGFDLDSIEFDEPIQSA
ncbi:MAG: G8 domain-containing protein, partial [Pirellulaceae bacterium]